MDSPGDLGFYPFRRWCGWRVPGTIVQVQRSSGGRRLALRFRRKSTSAPGIALALSLSLSLIIKGWSPGDPRPSRSTLSSRLTMSNEYKRLLSARTFIVQIDIIAKNAA
jgi:hypothetical protein